MPKNMQALPASTILVWSLHCLPSMLQAARPSNCRSLAWFPTLRLCRVRSMLAMRACRSSVMIGKPLDKGAMQAMLKRMAGLAAPWNCPHGRPTMRHLCQLQDAA